MKTIKTLEEVYQAITEHPGRLYVRWSTNPQKDIERGYSLDHAAGRAERGLSCVRVTGRADTVYTDPERQARADRERLIRQLTAYAMLRYGQPRIQCWLLTGECVGTDSDGCPVVVDAEPVGRLVPKLVEQLLNEAAEIRRREMSHGA